jgi:hypothetical protein
MNSDSNHLPYSLVKNHIPYYFMNKIEESNIVIGQQQLETYILLINILKNKNKDEKIETIKRNNIQKCIQWCEKYKIPHNKFMDKTNIFLNDRMIREHTISIEEQSKTVLENKFNIDTDADADVDVDLETDIVTNIELELDIDLDITNYLDCENV